MKIVWTIAGFICVGLGTIGIFLPLLPTTVFMILAAFCFTKGSARAHAWLMGHRIFGPMIHDWQTRGAIAPKSKIVATISIALVYTLSLYLGLKLWVLILQAVTLGCVLIFIWTRPDN